jgi:hypothetical protein
MLDSCQHTPVFFLGEHNPDRSHYLHSAIEVYSSIGPAYNEGKNN